MSSNIFTVSFLNSFYIEKDSISFSLRNIINPSSSAQTSSFQISLLDKDGSLMERQIDKLTYLPIPGIISDIVTEFTNYKLGALTNITISFKKQSPLNELGFKINENIRKL